MNRYMIAVALSASTAVFAAEEPTDTLQLDPVQVTAEPFAGRGELESTRPVDVLVGEDLDRERAATLGETLDQQPGIANASFGPGSGRVVIRGQSGPRVRVLDGGVGVIDASTVSPDHNISTEPFRAKQIEILRGPAALLYGNGAIGGVINVVSDTIPTESVDGNHGELGTQYDSARNGRSVFGHVESGFGRFNLHIDGLARRTDDIDIPGFAEAEHEEHEEDGDHADEHEEEEASGTLANSSTSTNSAAIGTSWVDDWGFVGASLTTYRTNYGIPGHHHEEEHEEEGHEDEEGGVRIDLNQLRYDAKFEVMNPFPALDRLRGAVVISDYEHTEIEPSGEPGTRFENDGIEARIEATHAPFGDFSGVVGLQWINSEFSAIGEEAFVPPVDTQSVGLFWVEEWQLDALRLEAGARVESTEHEPEGGAPARDYSTLSLSLGGNHALSDTVNLAVSLSRSQRAPSSQELYSNGPHLASETFEVGNLSLDEEIANNLDVSLHWQTDRFDAELTAFVTRYNDYIFQAETDALLPDGEPDRVDEEGVASADGELLYVTYTQADADFAGAEASFSLLAVDSATTGQWRPRLFADTVSGELTDGGSLPRITPSRVGAGLDWERGPFGADLRLTHVARQRDTASLETETDAYNRLDADLTWVIRGQYELLLGLRGRNLLDEEIRDHTSFIKDIAPGAGRSVIVDASVVF